jgi:hypothetical protein
MMRIRRNLVAIMIAALSVGATGPVAHAADDAAFVLCRAHRSDTRLALRTDRCRSSERRLSIAEAVDALGLLGPGAPSAQAINKCGQAACLCTGSFCADLIDANYCADFHCGGDQCICVFPES